MNLSRVLLAPKWDIFASVFLSRNPLIAAPMSPIETRFNIIQNADELENSLLNDFELKTKNDDLLLEKRATLEREGKELSELDGEIGITNAMRIDEWDKRSKALIDSWNLGNPRHFESEDAHSLLRLLDRKLVLIVKQHFGDSAYNSPWIVPQMRHKGGETLRQTAERCLGEISSCSMNVSLRGNAPYAVHTQKYSKPLKEKTGFDGAKIFFFASVLGSKSPFETNKNEIADHRWVSREEFWSTVPGSDYKSAVSSAFLE